MNQPAQATPDAGVDASSEAGSSAGRDAAPDPYAGLDEVTRAKRRLLDEARQGEDAAARPPNRRVAWSMALTAFVAGFAVARVPWLRRPVLRTIRWAVMWLVKQMLR